MRPGNQFKCKYPDNLPKVESLREVCFLRMELCAEMNFCRLFFFTSRAETQADRCAEESVSLANLVLEKPAVGEVHQLGIVDVEEERGRVGIHLADVKEFEAASRLEGRLVFVHRIADDAVEF